MGCYNFVETVQTFLKEVYITHGMNPLGNSEELVDFAK